MTNISRLPGNDDPQRQQTTTPAATDASGVATLLRWLRVWLDVPHPERRIALLALVLCLPSLALGLQADDYLLAKNVAKDPLGAFAFIPGRALRDSLHDAGDVSWTASTTLMQSFARPLASLSHWVDFTYLRGAPWFMHLENVVLYVALVLVAASVFRRIFDDRFTTALAGLLYAVNGMQSTTVGWISGRNTLLAAALGLGSFGLHLGSRSAAAGRRVWLVIGSLCLFVIALGASEGALAVLGLIAAHALTLDPAGRRAGAIAAVPALLFGAAYVAARGVLGHGAHGMGLYVDLGNPAALARSIVQGVPTYLGSQMTVWYGSLSAFRVSGPTRYALLSLVVCSALAPLFWPLLRADARARFCLLAAASCAVVLGGTVPQDRLVFFVGIGIAGLLALRCTQPDVRRWAKVLGSVLLHIHVILAGVLFVPFSLVAGSMGLGGGAAALDEAMPEQTEATVVVVHAPSEVLPSWARARRDYDGRPAPRFVRVLYGGQAPVTARALDERTLELEVERGWLATPMERAQSDRTDFRVGEIVSLPGMRAEVRSVTSDGTPRTVRFTFDTPLREMTLLRFEHRAFVPWSAPADAQAETLPAITPF